MNAQQRAYSIRIFLPDGHPDGLRLIEKSNWVGQGIVCPRSQYRSAKLRREFGRTGVYVLHAPAEAAGLPTIYLGEGDPARPRLDQHHATKDFWTTLTLFTSKDENLNKAHVQYLEARLVGLAREAKRCVLDNSNSPQLPTLGEAEIAEMEGFLAEMLLIFPVLGMTVFEKPAPAQAGQRVLFIRAKGLKASGYEDADKFVVMAGSQVARESVPSTPPYVIALRGELLKQGVIEDAGSILRMARSYAFNSPSSAAAVLLGRSANGRVEWKDQDGRALKDLQSPDGS